MRKFSQFDSSYSPNPTFMTSPEFANVGGMLHNNLGQKVINEYITEYKIHIDTKDRDLAAYPSPFKTKVYFGKSDGISRKFENVKFVTLDSIILPKTNCVDISHIAEPNIYPSNSNYVAGILDGPNILSVLAKRRNLYLKIEELESENNLGTSSLLENNTFILVEDCCAGIDSHVWKPVHNTIIYKNSSLQNLNKLTLVLYDEYGNELKVYDQLGNQIIGKNMTGFAGDYNTFINGNSYLGVPSDSVSYIPSKLDYDSVKYTNNIMQVQYNFTFGQFNTELTTKFI